jgi:hypothetical protein
LPRRNQNEIIERLGSRNKSGNTIFSRRKARKVTEESQLTQAEIAWGKDYAAVLKAVGYSNRYIGDTLGIRSGIIKEWLNEDDQKQKIATVQTDIVNGAVDHLRRHAVELTEMLLELARRTTDDGVRLKAIVEGLDRVGLAKVNKSESIVTKTEHTEHDLSADFFERLEGLPLETQQQLASMAAEMDKIVEQAKGQG